MSSDAPAPSKFRIRPHHLVIGLGVAFAVLTLASGIAGGIGGGSFGGAGTGTGCGAGAFTRHCAGWPSAR